MKLVISASRRTDIPAFYMDWMINAVRTGSVDVQNPFYKNSTYRVDLKPERVEWIVFWSRNYSNFLKHRNYFEAYKLFFHFTILSPHRYLEKNHLSSNRAIQQMERLVYLYGADHIIWRYDPIVTWLSGTKIETNFVESDFKQLCEIFTGMGIRRCYFSFVTPYKKFIRRFSRLFPDLKLIFTNKEYTDLISTQMSEIAELYDMQLFSCCNDHIISGKIQKGSCISGTLLNKLSGKKIVSEAKSPGRPQCGCSRALDKCI